MQQEKPRHRFINPRKTNIAACNMGGCIMRKVFVAGLISKLSLLLMANGASASSFITAGVPDQTPSIISAGEATAAAIEIPPEAVTADDTKIIAIGKSIIAVGPDAIPPSQEKVAATAELAEEAAPQAEWLTDDASLSLRGSD